MGANIKAEDIGLLALGGTHRPTVAYLAETLCRAHSRKSCFPRRRAASGAANGLTSSSQQAASMGGPTLPAQRTRPCKSGSCCRMRALDSAAPHANWFGDRTSQNSGARLNAAPVHEIVLRYITEVRATSRAPNGAPHSERCSLPWRCKRTWARTQAA
jgi:hypothetical protein